MITGHVPLLGGASLGGERLRVGGLDFGDVVQVEGVDGLGITGAIVHRIVLGLQPYFF